MWSEKQWLPNDVLIPRTCGYVTLHGKRESADLSGLRTLKWGDNPGLSRRPSLITWVLKIRESFPVVFRRSNNDGASVTQILFYWLWRWKKGAISQGMWAASASHKKQRNAPPASSFQLGTQPCRLLDFGSVRPCQISGLQNIKMMNLRCLCY